MVKTNNYVKGEHNNCLNYQKECWTCIYQEVYGQWDCSRPNQPRIYTTTSI
jgi:hypothetical protein